MKYLFRFLQNGNSGVFVGLGHSIWNLEGALKPVWSATSSGEAERHVWVSTVSERDYVVGRGSGLSALHPFASGEEISFDIIWV